MTWRTSGSRRRSSPIRRPTKCMSRTATGTGASSSSTPTRGSVQAALGRLRSAGRTTRRCRRTSPTGAAIETIQHHALRRSSRTTGCVYVCDRVNDRIQVFRKDGTFVKEAFIDPTTYRSGSVWDMAFSRDPQQTYIYAANGVDEKINVLLRSFARGAHVVRRRRTAARTVLGVQIGDRLQGRFYDDGSLHRARVQRFVFEGVKPVTRKDQGCPAASRASRKHHVHPLWPVLFSRSWLRRCSGEAPAESRPGRRFHSHGLCTAGGEATSMAKAIVVSREAERRGQWQRPQEPRRLGHQGEAGRRSHQCRSARPEVQGRELPGAARPTTRRTSRRSSSAFGRKRRRRLSSPQPPRSSTISTRSAKPASTASRLMR